MQSKMRIGLLFTAFIFYTLPIVADELPASYGTAKEDFHEYPPISVVFDLQMTGGGGFSGLYKSLKEVHDTLKGRMVVVVHGTELSIFAKQHYEQYRKTVDQLADLAQQGVRFRAGKQAMRAAGYKTEDMYGFVTIVPSGLAEIAYLQADGYRYLQLSPKNVPANAPVQKSTPTSEEPRFKFSY